MSVGELLDCRSSSSSSGCCDDTGGSSGAASSSASSTASELLLGPPGSEARDRELSACYRQLAERDTDLVRVRMECQRLLEDNRGLREEARRAAARGTTRRQLELEKEVEHLKWQLQQVRCNKRGGGSNKSSMNHNHFCRHFFSLFMPAVLIFTPFEALL